MTFFDTAQIYGAVNEEIVGEGLKPFRGQVVIATAADLQHIEDATATITVHGARYPEHLQQRVGR